MTTTAIVNCPIRITPEQAFHFDVDRVIENVVTRDLAAAEIIAQDPRGGTCSFDTHKERP